MKSSNRAYALLFLLFVLSFGYWIGGAASVYDDLKSGPERARMPFEFGFRLQTIGGSLPEARAAGAQYGDTLVEFDGRPFTAVGVVRDAVLKARPGSVVPAEVRRPDGTSAHIVIRLAAVRTAPATASEWLRDVTIELAFPLFCLLLGFWVAAARPLDKNAWLLLGIMISLEFLIPTGNSGEPWQFLRTLWTLLAIYSWPAWMMLFGIYFPERSILDRGAPWVKWAILVLLVVSSIPVLVLKAGMEISFATVAFHLRQVDGVHQHQPAQHAKQRR